MGETEDAYSAFQARDGAGVPLPTLLRQRDVRRLFVMGLATDYCVKASALDGAQQHHLAITVVAAGIRAVNVQAGDGERAIAEMRAAGIKVAA